MIAAREYDFRSKTSYASATARILPGRIFGNDASMNSIKATAILAMPVLAAAAGIGANVFAQEAKAPAKDYNRARA
jgi:hypothetical protein